MGWHRGLVIKRGGCQLSMPYVLWDTRTWDGTMGVGTGGLPNLGIAGTAFDLDVRQNVLGGDVYTFADQNNSVYTATPSVSWVNLGGEPCVAPFTFITAIGSLPPNITGVPDPDGFVEADIIFNNQGLYCQTYLFPALGAVEDKAENSAFTQIYTANSAFDYTYALWSPPNTEVEGSADVYIRETLLVVTLTPKDNSGTMYRIPYPSGTSISVAENTVNGLQEEFDVFVDPTFCDVAAEEIAGDTHFFYFGEDRRIGSSLVPGEPWNSGIGAALFRGCPNEADLLQWYNYFFGDYVPWDSRIAYSGGWGIWTDGTYAYHEFRSGDDLTPIPGRTLPATIDFLLVGGGGGSSGYVTTTFEGGGGGGGGEVIEGWNVTAPVTTQTFVQGAGGLSQADGGNSTFMGYTALGGKGSVGANGGASGGGTPGGTRIVAPVIKAAGGGGSDTFPGGDASGVNGEITGKGGLGIARNWVLGGATVYFGSGGNGGGQTGSTTQTPPDGGGGSNDSPVPVSARGGGAGGRISTSNSAGFTGATGGLVIRYLLP